MLSTKTSVKLNKSVYERAQTHSDRAGYSSVDEFVEHLLERELARLEEATSRADIASKLNGLGYLE
jgi:ectoine hydroxylase-related dioxygenase (phytanoyl-CoA dioxygenase family)